MTGIVLATMLACAWGTDTFLARLPAESMQRLGCAPEDYLSLRAWCAITSLPFTWGGFSFLGLLPLVVLSLGLCEWSYGSWRTAGIFLATHVLAGAAEAAALRALAPLLGVEGAAALLSAPDVGPSAGCFGCLGAVIARLPPRRQAAAAATLLLFLVAISFWRPDPGFASATLWLSDLAHPVAAVAGYAYGRALSVGQSRPAR